MNWQTEEDANHQSDMDDTGWKMVECGIWNSIYISLLRSTKCWEIIDAACLRICTTEMITTDGSHFGPVMEKRVTTLTEALHD